MGGVQTTCEHCGDESLSWETWEPIEKPEHGWGEGGRARCLHENDLVEGVKTDDEVDGCPFPAAWTYLFTGPSEHLCSQHEKEREQFYKEKHGEVPAPVGLEDVGRFLPIETDEACEAFDEATMRECGRQARWVSVDTYDLEACKHHYRREALGAEPRL